MHGVVSRLTRPAAASSLLQRPARLQRRQQRLEVANTYPEPETEKERSPIDYPQVCRHTVPLCYCVSS